MNELIHSIYDAAIDPKLWPAVLDRLVDASGAFSCAIFESDEYGGSIPFQVAHMSNAFPITEFKNYALQYLAHETVERSLAKSALSTFDEIEAISDEAVYDDYEEFLNQPNVKSMMEFGLRHRVIAFLNKDNLDLSQFTLQYADGRGPATAEELNRLNVLLPHLAKSLDLSRPARQLASERLDVLGAMDRLVVGISVLDRHGRIVQENREFCRQRQECGVFEEAPNGVLRFKNAKDEKRFHELKSDVRNHGKFGARPRKEVISKEDGGYLSVELQHLNRFGEISSGIFTGFVLYSIDTSLPVSINPAALQQAFGLTQAEAALIPALANGMTNTEIAETNGRAVPTINGQVKSILSKTQCSTRTQFVRLLMSFGVNLLRDD
ncbi:helix-turn-helix transcriptional regulator [Roseibium sp. SCP14]|uniref:helix-turn-helix transcriptional regulator n=1 Tax=Roseibium sp. SCP14 TaxID=3141375 RepID=UPI00333C15DD